MKSITLLITILSLIHMKLFRQQREKYYSDREKSFKSADENGERIDDDLNWVIIQDKLHRREELIRKLRRFHLHDHYYFIAL